MSSGRIVLDSYALIAYFENEKGAGKVERFLCQAESSRTPLLLSTVNWGEVYYALYRSKGKRGGERYTHNRSAPNYCCRYRLER